MRDDFDLVVSGAVVVAEHDIEAADLGIAGEKIAALAAPGTLRGRRTIEARPGSVLVPGGIDTHTHIAWPIADGVRSLDDFASASRAAAVSGTTTVIDFVPAADGSLTAAAEARLAEAESSVVDYTFHPVIARITPRRLGEIPALVDAGMSSFKIYTTYDDRLDDAEIRAVMGAVAEAGGLAGFHAENHSILERAKSAVLAESGAVIGGFPGSRPGSAESAAIGLVTHFARELGAPVFVYHVSGGEALSAIETARETGVLVQAETCTHYLVLDDGVYAREDGWKYVITPPIRDAAARDRLWDALRAGVLGSVASDHCAYGLEHKLPGAADFTALPPGAPGLDARIPFLWHHGVTEGRLGLRRFTEVSATGPARTFGLYPRKGVIRVGADADLVLWNPGREWTWPAFPSGWGSDYEPYEGMTGTGLPELTISRGRVVASDGRFTGDGATGRFVPQRIDTRLWP
ncbi:dihydropyrimidinase [Thermocatellispora tengchongensis]|uniref:Dihydropyrimidinase n=1 Tax=Thermocatellispora tengchongensis TaxID=1073253 RepID=A0A840P6Y0_9ACTN|nr:amidohydrolase family protein [Thermocatellispora tengchongensis]MBB5135418.1 dihydropyrimidinase [Thermocatellispora tengchongensis]